MIRHGEECGRLMKQTLPHSGYNFAFRPILDAPSKNIYDTSSLKVMLASMTSSGMSSCSFEVSGTGSAAKKSARA